MDGYENVAGFRLGPDTISGATLITITSLPTSHSVCKHCKVFSDKDKILSKNMYQLKE